MDWSGLAIFRIHVSALLGLLAGPTPEPEGPAALFRATTPDVFLGDDPCAEAEPDGVEDLFCGDRRQVFLDYTTLGIEGRVGGEWITYNYEEVTRPVQAADLSFESELSLAVRLIVSEVGADRLLVNRNGLAEGIGILYTVDNRLDPLVYNPENHPNAPDFPGCGPGGTFGTCADPEQYLGLLTWRALNPRSHYDDRLLEEAVAVAVLAWYLQENGLVEDITGGATNYVHRCGGAAYGMKTYHCDAHLGAPARDVPGGKPFTGPTVFKAPSVFMSRKGFYALTESLHIDYLPWWGDPSPAEDDALAELDDDWPAAPASVELSNLLDQVLGEPI
jgi:hypothetical protein